MGTLVPIGQSRPPSKLLGRKGSTGSGGNFTAEIVDSFPRLSIRGKSFWLRANGKEIRAGAVDPEKGAILDIVLVNASRHMAKSYYKKAFGGAGSNDQPDCWSLDSVRPDASIAKPVNEICLPCPMNAFNSAPSGRGGKACADSKRVVITTADQLGKQEPVLLIMRVPQQSHKNMKAHIEKLAYHGYTEPYAAVTRLSFDQAVEFPKMLFDFVEPLTDDEFEAAEELANSKRVNDMLKNPDFDNAASNEKVANDDDEVVTTLRHSKRAPQQGFGAEGSEAEAPAEAAPAKAETQSADTVDVPTGDEWEDLGDGTELNLQTGDMRKKVIEAEVLEPDPDVLQTSDGRYFNRSLKKFVDSPYKNAKPAPISKIIEPEVEDKPKRTRKPRAAKVEEPVEEPKEEPVQAVGGNGNGVEAPKPKVVAASPKLDALLGGLVPNDDEK